MESTAEPHADAVAMSVLGPVPRAELGVVLPHEHLWVDNSVHHIPYDGVDPRAAVTPERIGLLRVRPHALRSNLILDDVDAIASDLARYRRSGGSTLVELTPYGLGRDLSRVAELARLSGLNVIAGTGYYVARTHATHVAGRPTAALVAEMQADLLERAPAAGVIGEIGISAEPTQDEWRVLDAAIEVQRDTGAPVWVHQTTTAPMRAIVERLRSSAVDPDRIVLCHVDYDLRDVSVHREALAMGLTIEMDLFGFPAWNRGNFVDAPDDRLRVERILEFIADGHAERLLVSQDVCMKTQLARYGGFGYAHLLENVQELFTASGGTDDAWRTLTRDNPARLLAWRSPESLA